MYLEICCDTLNSCVIAAKAGANRIELCSALSEGGLTSSYGLIQKVMQHEHINIPVHVLIRPRAGGFVYCKDEVEIMKADILKCIELNVNGIVIGALTSKNDIDYNIINELLKVARVAKLNVTFHRAFDFVSQPILELEKLHKLYIHTILTSGQYNNAIEGADNIIKFIVASRTFNSNERNIECNKPIDIMAGSGINVNNVKYLCDKISDLEFVHGSFRENIKIEKKSNTLTLSNTFEQKQASFKNYLKMYIYIKDI